MGKNFHKEKWKNKDLATEVFQLKKLWGNELMSLREWLNELSTVTPDACFLTDLQGIFIDGNKTTEALLGYRPEELTGKNFFKLNLLYPIKIKKAIMLFAKNKKWRPVVPEEFSVNRKDGSQIELEIKVFPVSINREISVLHIARDITKRKQTEKLLQKSEKKYRTLFESSQDAVIITDQNRKILLGNPAAIKMFGCADNEELTSLKVTDLSPEYQPDGIRSSVTSAQMVEIARGSGSYFSEWKYKRKDGKEFFTTVLLTRMELENEFFLQCTVRDITENKVTEDSLKKFKTISDNQTIGNAIADSGLNLVYHNKAFAEMHGYNDKELTGMNLSNFLPYEELEKIKNLNTAKERRLKNNEYYNDEFWHLRNDGSVFPTLTNVSEIRNEKGAPLFWAASVIDITERKQAEEALKQSEKELKGKAGSLEKTNNALEVLLKKREEDKKKLEETVLFNISRVVEPYLEKLKDSISDKKQKLYLSIIEENLKDIISTFPQEILSRNLKLTATEIEVANLVKQGKSTKQIAAALNISLRTVEVHRVNIRKKLNLNKKKASLRAHLLSSFSA